MESSYSLESALSTQLPQAVVAELEVEHRRELRRLNDVAFLFLQATENDRVEAQRLSENFIDLVFEGGVLSTWRYRILLAEIRRGL